MKANRNPFTRNFVVSSFVALALPSPVNAQSAPTATPTEAPSIGSQVPEAASTPTWVQKFKLEGDFRYRHEYLSATPTPASQHVHKLRARAGTTVDVHPELKVHLWLATGGTSPTSSNQSLDDAFARKAIGLDLAYLQYAPVESFTIAAGKMRNPLYRPGNSQLVWDGDITPEGLNLKFASGALWAQAPIFIIDERAAENDGMVLGLEVGAKLGSGDFGFDAAISYFNFTNTKGKTLYVDATKNFGNSVAGTSLYATGFNLAHGGMEASYKGFGAPLALFVDAVVNTAADADRIGALVGLSYGKAAKAGSFGARYAFRRVEADAVVGAFSDSDFRGGGTNGKGHDFTLEYAPTDATKVGLTYILAAKGVDADLDYHRAQLDLNVKF